MQAAAEIFERLRRRRAPVWAALVALGIFQLAVVGHSAAHSLADVAETCQLCTQLDENEVLRAVAAAFAAHAAPPVAIPESPETKKTATYRNTRKARGPPLS